MGKVILLVLTICLLSTNVICQIDRSGFAFGFGIGFGYSKHADSYTAIEDPLIGIVEDFGGVRVMSMDLKIGWGYAPRAMVFWTLKYTPPFIGSPYRSTYHGPALTYSPEFLESLIFIAGAGINKVGDKEGKLGRGYLTNIGLAYEFSPNVLVEANTVFGKMDNMPSRNRFFSTSKEFFFNLTFNYLFY